MNGWKWTARPRPACATCGDLRYVHRIVGGVKFSQACPDCAGGAW